MVTATDHAIRALMGSDPPPILYHYTSMQGLLSIVETGRIRATHIRYLNDWSEAQTLWTFVLKRLHERRDSSKSTEENANLSEIISLAHARRLPSEFVASFSEEGDDLSQWRSYCPGEAGFSIGFSSAALHSQWVSDPAGREPSFVGAQLHKIIYLNESDTSEIDLHIDGIVKLAALPQGIEGIGGPDVMKRFVVAWLTVIAPSYKNSAFRSESEWRLVLTKPHKPMPGQRFRAGKSTLIPYIEVDIDRETDPKLSKDYMIRKVIVGPTPNSDLAFEAVQSLFLSKGHGDVLVEKSAIPYRHW
jgi:hypothetical protein